jgi:hypothetical protein
VQSTPLLELRDASLLPKKLNQTMNSPTVMLLVPRDVLLLLNKLNQMMNSLTAMLLELRDAKLRFPEQHDVFSLPGIEINPSSQKRRRLPNPDRTTSRWVHSLDAWARKRRLPRQGASKSVQRRYLIIYVSWTDYII